MGKVNKVFLGGSGGTEEEKDAQTFSNIAEREGGVGCVCVEQAAWNSGQQSMHTYAGM